MHELSTFHSLGGFRQISFVANLDVVSLCFMQFSRDSYKRRAALYFFLSH